MKITQKKILQMTRSVLRGEKHYGEHLLLHPTREWTVGLICFLVLCVGGGWWAATVYMRYVDVSLLVSDRAVPEMTTYRGVQVAEALAILDVRRLAYETIFARHGGVTNHSTLIELPAQGMDSSSATPTPALIIPPTSTGTQPLLVTEEALPVEEEVSEQIVGEGLESSVPVLAD